MEVRKRTGRVDLKLSCEWVMVLFGRYDDRVWSARDKSIWISHRDVARKGRKQWEYVISCLAEFLTTHLL